MKKFIISLFMLLAFNCSAFAIYQWDTNSPDMYENNYEDPEDLDTRLGITEPPEGYRWRREAPPEDYFQPGYLYNQDEIIEHLKANDPNFDPYIDDFDPNPGSKLPDSWIEAIESVSAEDFLFNPRSWVSKLPK
ncbi:MAG: hypothetical protein LBM02_06855 [Lachnospiraceae bacterium]|jgi:hypothetical protein|nr:hypothetical protein [Lachnospiraceae bacterium]